MCSTEVPLVSPAIGVTVLILNIFLPGIGTIVSAFADENVWICNFLQLIIGLIQLIFFWTIIAWIWAIIFGLMVYERSMKSEVKQEIATGIQKEGKSSAT